MTSSATPKRTPLYDRHLAQKARIIDFGGWAMPVQYSGIIDEHKAVRSACGLFDVSHMGEVSFTGARAGEAVQRLITNDVGRVEDGRALYTVACRPSGGIIDDCIVYRERSDSYLIVVNASNIEKDFTWFKEQTGALCQVENLSDETALLALQGPKAVAILSSLTTEPVAQLPYFGWSKIKVGSTSVRAARTGYTGEDGFELFCDPAHAPALWDLLLEKGAPLGLQPIGLGARDTLRLEAKLCLYGNDIDEEHTPHEAGLSWVVKGKGFIGEEALARQKAEGLSRKLVGFIVRERGIARHGYPILDEKGAAVGVVTSGTTGPTVEAAIGMGYIPLAMSKAGTRLVIDCRGKQVAAEVVEGPFYKRPK